jgi:glucan phosphoethanolaminetransferase (alkaline phosphatase superfamily)
MERNYKIETKSNKNLIYGGIVILIINILWFNPFSEIEKATNPTEKEVNQILIIYFIYFTILVGFTVWSAIVARKLRRSAIFWGIMTFFFAPIAMIVLGLKDAKVEDELKAVVNKHKSNYFLETIKLKKDYESGKLKEKEYQDRLNESKDKHEELMNIELERKKKVIENRHVVEVIEKVEGYGKAVLIGDKCPACGAKITEKDDVCPDCELNLK